MITINLLPPDMRVQHRKPKSVLFAIGGSSLLVLISAVFFAWIHWGSLPQRQRALAKAEKEKKDLDYAAQDHKSLTELIKSFSRFSQAIEQCQSKRQADYARKLSVFSEFVCSVMSHLPLEDQVIPEHLEAGAGEKKLASAAVENWEYWIEGLDVRSVAPKAASSGRGRGKQVATTGPQKIYFAWKAKVKSALAGPLPLPGAGHNLRALTTFTRSLKAYAQKNYSEREKISQIKLPAVQYLFYKDTQQVEGTSWSLDMLTELALGRDPASPAQDPKDKAKGNK